MTIAQVNLWGSRIGVVSLHAGASAASFEYDRAFLGSGIEVAPLTMPLAPSIYSFDTLNPITFRRLPALLADSLPDKFGNTLIDAWLAGQGRDPESFDAVERLCYIGQRGMGALEFAPVLGPTELKSKHIDVDALVDLASRVLEQRSNLKASFSSDAATASIHDILTVGTSAGGARAKAVIAWNDATNEIRAGQVTAGPGFSYWLMKFDGVRGNKDKELADPKGYGAIEYAYSNMAKAAGINVPDARLFEEGGRRHFMVKRFDRLESGDKLHMQSLGAMANLDFNMPRSNSYEQAFFTMRKLALPTAQVEELFGRMAFNIIARNQDDHVKNIAFLMGREGQWSLSPAFDMTLNYNPEGGWTNQHQMSLNGQRSDFTLADFDAGAKSALLNKRRARSIVSDVREAVSRWPEFAKQADIEKSRIKSINGLLRLNILI